MKRALTILLVLTSTFALARGKRVTVTVLASTAVGGMSGDDCTAKPCHLSRVSAQKVDEIAIAAELDGRHVILYCNNATESRCKGLRPGHYKAELKSDSLGDFVLIKAFRPDGKKSKPIKYAIR